jgi:hypothetical protein
MASNNDCHPGMATRILQWNVQRSVDKAMAPLLRDPKITGYTVIAIQEPWLNPYQNTTHYPGEAARLFKLAWPKLTGDHRPRVCTYVRRNISEADIIIQLSSRYTSGPKRVAREYTYTTYITSQVTQTFRGSRNSRKP